MKIINIIFFMFFLNITNIIAAPDSEHCESKNTASLPISNKAIGRLLASGNQSREETEYWDLRRSTRDEARELLNEVWNITNNNIKSVYDYAKRIMGLTHLADYQNPFATKMPTVNQQALITSFIKKLKVKEPEDFPGNNYANRKDAILNNLKKLNKIENSLYNKFKNSNDIKAEIYRSEVVKGALALNFFKSSYIDSRYHSLKVLHNSVKIRKVAENYDIIENQDNLKLSLEEMYRNIEEHQLTQLATYAWVIGGGTTDRTNKRLPKDQRDREKGVSILRVAANKGNEKAIRYLTIMDTDKKKRVIWAILSDHNKSILAGGGNPGKPFTMADRLFDTKMPNYDMYVKNGFFREKDLLE